MSYFSFPIFWHPIKRCKKIGWYSSVIWIPFPAFDSQNANNCMSCSAAAYTQRLLVFWLYILSSITVKCEYGCEVVVLSCCIDACVCTGLIVHCTSRVGGGRRSLALLFLGSQAEKFGTLVLKDMNTFLHCHIPASNDSVASGVPDERCIRPTR